MIAYIAGQMNGLPDKGRHIFDRAERYLKSVGYTVLNPAVLPDGMNATQYMPICLAMLEQADMIVMLPNWQNSKGATLERKYAIYQGKDVCMLRDAEFMEGAFD